MTLAWVDALHDSGLVCGNPIFVIGSARSGTSALAKALGTHPMLWTSNETKFLAYLFGDGRPDAVHAIELSRPTVSWVRTHDVDADEFLVAAGIGMNALLTSRAGGRRWVDHTPDYTALADLLARMYPGAHFVQIIRDGRAVVHSMLHFADMFTGDRRAAVEPDLPQYFKDVRAACEMWSERIEQGARFVATHPDRCTTVRHEELERDPAATLARILADLGVPADPGPARFIATKRINSSVAATPSTGQEPPWDRWPSEWRAAFSECCGPVQRHLGYEPVELSSS